MNNLWQRVPIVLTDEHVLKIWKYFNPSSTSLPSPQWVSHLRGFYYLALAGLSAEGRKEVNATRTNPEETVPSSNNK